LENDFGFQHDTLKVLKGGIQAWQDAGYGTEQLSGVICSTLALATP
jgi:3-mercaptopyruvate sulfurtransferase SseA